MDLPALTPLATAVLDVPSNPERILEIGCGEGDGVLFLAREYPSARIRGVDSSADAIRGAVARVGLDPEGRVAFKQGRPSSLPYPDGFFDLVVQSDGRLRMREVARVLRPGGHLIFARTGHPGLLGSGLTSWQRSMLKANRFETVKSAPAGSGTFLVARSTGGD
ncbi:MAG: class I SAM-dependent methyltransferase [Solirubrobacterales bacterium]